MIMSDALPPFQIEIVAENVKRLVAQCDFANGDCICPIEGEALSAPTRTSIFANGSHIEPSNGLQFLNHSCSPNARILRSSVVATKTINRGDEITFDYQANEPVISHPFDCQCRAFNCRQRIE